MYYYLPTLQKIVDEEFEIIAPAKNHLEALIESGEIIEVVETEEEELFMQNLVWDNHDREHAEDEEQDFFDAVKAGYHDCDGNFVF